MTDNHIGRIHPTADKTTATCAKCPWTFETTVPGQAAHELMDHNEKEHS